MEHCPALQIFFVNQAPDSLVKLVGEGGLNPDVEPFFFLTLAAVFNDPHNFAIDFRRIEWFFTECAASEIWYQPLHLGMAYHCTMCVPMQLHRKRASFFHVSPSH